jgi:hypothetical protein
MKKYVIMAIATLVVSAATVVAVKAYQYYSMPPLMRANLEALTQNEGPIKTKRCYIEVVGGDYINISDIPFCHRNTNLNGDGYIYPCETRLGCKNNSAMDRCLPR